MRLVLRIAGWAAVTIVVAALLYLTSLGYLG